MRKTCHPGRYTSRSVPWWRFFRWPVRTRRRWNVLEWSASRYPRELCRFAEGRLDDPRESGCGLVLWPSPARRAPTTWVQPPELALASEPTSSRRSSVANDSVPPTWLVSPRRRWAERLERRIAGHDHCQCERCRHWSARHSFVQGQRHRHHRRERLRAEALANVTGGGTHTIGCTSRDLLGNSANAGDTGGGSRHGVTAPSLTRGGARRSGAPYTAGAWVNAGVAVSFVRTGRRLRRRVGEPSGHGLDRGRRAVRDRHVHRQRWQRLDPCARLRS